MHEGHNTKLHLNKKKKPVKEGAKVWEYHVHYGGTKSQLTETLGLGASNWSSNRTEVDLSIPRNYTANNTLQYSSMIQKLRKKIHGLLSSRDNRGSILKEAVKDLFKEIKHGLIQLPEPRWPTIVGKSDNIKYCLYHRLISHFIVVKWEIQEFIDKKRHPSFTWVDKDVCQPNSNSWGLH